ncbi:chitobiase/beta-hexosaminidase C-terminal domain-containing protein [Patescibacteria group bacterium]|nr:chitobiase/beta-hexosaminidase C-terminal domain-containing protein [Patescibacteria group bacterium]
MFFIVLFRAISDSYHLLFSQSHESFEKFALKKGFGTYAQSYSSHKNYISGLRYFAVTTLTLTLTASFIVFVIYSAFFPFKNIPQALAATFTVDTNNDTNDAILGNGVCADAAGDCSLRAAIQEINALGGGPHIISIGNSVSGQTVNATTGLDTLLIDSTTIELAVGTASFTIDGTAAGAGQDGLDVRCNSCSVDGLDVQNFDRYGIYWDGSDGELRYSELNDNGAHALAVASGESNFTVVGVVAGGNGGSAFVIDSSGTVSVTNSMIGTNAAGDTANSNSNYGINVPNAILTVTGSVVSNNGNEGIRTSTGSGHVISNNRIGCNNAGTADMGNGLYGLSLRGSSSTVSGNRVCGNGNPFFTPMGGMAVSGDNNIITNNIIGIGAGGEDLGNAISGIYIGDGADSNQITSNTIGNNDTAGIQAGLFASGINNLQINNNYIGVDSSDNQYANGDGIIGASLTNSVISGNVVSGNTDSGILLSGAGTDTITISQNNIGTNNAGTAAIANGDDGIELTGTIASVQIQDSVISGNTDNGISSTATAANTTIYDNRIGTNNAATAAIANGADGVYITNSTNLTIGATTDYNIISGNTDDGIFIDSCTNANINTNYIGTNTSSASLGNGDEGISIGDDSNGTQIEDVYIANNVDGITIANSGMGTAVSKEVTISENSIYNNSNIGISLEDGANESIEAPVITNVVESGGSTQVTVKTRYTGSSLELFYDENSQGENYIGAKTLTGSETSYTFNYAGILSAGEEFTATVTNVSGSTSEFGVYDTTAPITTASPAGGSYSVPQIVTLTATDDHDASPIIYYTIDGSDPTASSDSLDASGQVDIDTSLDLKFFAVDDLGNQESVKTENYVIGEDKLTITDLPSVEVGANTATITWKTSIAASSKVNYSKTSVLSNSETSGKDKTTHSIILTGLSANTKYYFNVYSESPNGQEVTSSTYDFTTYLTQVDPPEMDIVYPEDGVGYYLYMQDQDIDVQIELENKKLATGRNRVYIIDGEGEPVQQENNLIGKKFAKIGADGTSDFNIKVGGNEDIKTDVVDFIADAKKPNGNTSVKSEETSVVFGSTHTANTISFDPKKYNRPQYQTNVATTSQPTVASFLPLNGTPIDNVNVQLWSKNVSQGGLTYEGLATKTGGSDDSGIITFARTFYVVQPPGPIEVMFKVVNKNTGAVISQTDTFGIVYYKPSPFVFADAIQDGESIIITGNMMPNWTAEVFINDVFDGSTISPDSGTGTSAIAYEVFQELIPGTHEVTIRVWEEWGTPFVDTNISLTIEEAEPDTGGSGGGAEPVPTPPFTPSTEEEAETAPDEVEDVASTDVGLIEDLIDNNDSEKEDLAGENDSLEEEVSGLESTIEDIDAETEDLEERIDELEAEQEEAATEEEKEDIQEQIDELEEQIEENNQEKEDIQEQIDELETEIEDNNDESGQIDEENENISEDIEEEIDHLKEEKEKIEEEIKDLEEKIEDEKKKENPDEDLIADLEDQLKEKKDELDDINEKIDKLTDLLDRISKEPVTFKTKKIIELTQEEEQRLKDALVESLGINTIPDIIIAGVSYAGKFEDQITKFCIKRCLYPSVTQDDNNLYIKGSLDIPEDIGKKLA